MFSRAGAGALSSLLILAAPAGALTDAQIEAHARMAGVSAGAVVKALASDRLGGRDNDTPSSRRAQRLIVQRLRRIATGLNADVTGFESYRQPFTSGTHRGANVAAVIRGRELPDEYIVLGAHYDHFGTHSDPATGRCSSSFPIGGKVCNGATDNAAGTGVVLAIGRAIAKLPTAPRRSIVLALWDAEEDGLVGSAYWVANPLVPLAATRTYLNFDIQGSNLLPGLDHSTFAVGAETGGSALQAFVAAADDAEAAIDERPVSYIFGQGRSDYANFVMHGVPTVFFGDSTNGCYHTVGDDFANVDRKKLAAQARVGYRLAVALAETDAPPPFRAPRPTLADYADAVSLDAVFTDGLADLSLFPPADQAVIQQSQRDIHAIVADGPATFGTPEVTLLFAAASQGIDAIERLGCPKRR